MRRPALDRPRLIELLRGRFDLRVTTVLAPAGFGKSTLVAQAMAANDLEPEGIDRYVRLVAADAEPGHLLARLGEALHAAGPVCSVGELAAAIEREGPEDVAVIVDDVEVVTSATAWTVVQELIDLLPSNGHLVLVGRSRPPVNLRRLQAEGEVLVVTEQVLAFTDDELAALAGSDDPVAALPGWPALAALLLSGDPGAAVGYVREEVLDRLDPARRARLARYAAIGPFDAELAVAVAGAAATVPGDLVDLPLVHEESGVHRLDDLWVRALESDIGDGERRSALVAAGRVHDRRGDFVAAAEAFARAHEWGLLDRVARDFSALPLSAGLNRADADAVLGMLPPAERSGPLGHYLDVMRGWHLDPVELVRSMSEVADLATERGDGEMASLALWRLVQIQGDDDPLAVEADPRLLGLVAEGWPLARSALALVRSHEAQNRRDVAGAVAALDEYDGPHDLMVRLARGSRLLALGQPERHPVMLAEVLADGVTDPIAAQAVWWRGEIHPALAWPIARDLPDQQGPRRLPGAEVALLGIVSLVGAAAGDLGTARLFADRARDAAISLRPGARVFAGAADAVVALLESGDSVAVERLAALIDVVPLEPWPAWGYLSVLTPLRALVEGTEWLDELDLGPSLRVALAAGAAVRALRNGDLGPAARLPWLHPAILPVHVPLPYLTELLVGCLEEHPSAGELLSSVPDVARWLGRLPGHPNPVVARRAQALLKRYPQQPGYRLRISTLGRFDVERSDGVEVKGFDRRGRLKLLLALLIVERTSTRRALTARMWPEMAERQAANNFRVTLSALLDALEPDRADPSWFIRVDGDRLALTDSGIDLDVVEFELHMTVARRAEQRGAPLSALDHFTRACELYGGPFLADLDDPQLLPERTRLQTLAVHAWCRRAEIQLGRGEPEDAMAAAVRAVGIDPHAERAHRLVARCHLALGATTTALSVLRALVHRLRSDGQEPDPETTTLLDRWDRRDAARA